MLSWKKITISLYHYYYYIRLGQSGVQVSAAAAGVCLYVLFLFHRFSVCPLIMLYVWPSQSIAVSNHRVIVAVCVYATTIEQHAAEGVRGKHCRPNFYQTNPMVIRDRPHSLHTSCTVLRGRVHEHRYIIYHNTRIVGNTILL